MADREKVIKGIDICLQRLRCGEDCPYYNYEKIGCMEQLRDDALELLKEQEAPILTIDDAVSELMDRHYDRLKEQEEIKKLVRCNECKHRDPEDHKCDCGHDILWQLPRSDNWFCADGERRTDNGQ